jgi:hypothetical protein
MAGNPVFKLRKVAEGNTAVLLHNGRIAKVVGGVFLLGSARNGWDNNSSFEGSL